MLHSLMKKTFPHVAQSRCTDVMFSNRFKLLAVTLNSNIQNCQQCYELENNLYSCSQFNDKQSCALSFLLPFKTHASLISQAKQVARF